MSSDLEEAVWKLASPIDDQIHKLASSVSKKSTIRKRKLPSKLSFHSNLGLDVAQALIQHSRRHFCNYAVVRVPGQIPVQEIDDTPWCLSSNLAHAMWGCRRKQSGNDSCSICSGRVGMDAWLGLLASQQRKDNKTIYGAKQLPQFTSLWTTPSHAFGVDQFQIIAITSGTLWDSRTIQEQLLQEMLDFYSTLVLLTTTTESTGDDDEEEDESNSPFQIQAIDPSQLESHELSRIVVLVQGHDGYLFQLGSISNFGDAASRACGMQFAGGGSRKSTTKDYVHLVVATICQEETLQWLLWQQRNETMVAIPTCLGGYMAATTNLGKRDENCIWIPQGDLEPRDSLFGPKFNTSKSGKGEEKDRTSALPFVATSFPQSSDRARLEALTSPFDFLFG